MLIHPAVHPWNCNVRTIVSLRVRGPRVGWLLSVRTLASHRIMVHFPTTGCNSHQICTRVSHAAPSHALALTRRNTNQQLRYVSGVETTLRTRTIMMKTFLSRSAAWHDTHEVAALGEMLGSGAISPAQVTALPWSVYAALLAILGGGLIVAFLGCPELAGVMMVVMPILGTTAMMQMTLAIGGEESGSIPELEPSTQAAATIIMHSQLLASLGRSADYFDRYQDSVHALTAVYHKGAIKEAAANFVMQLVMFSCFGIGESLFFSSSSPFSFFFFFLCFFFSSLPTCSSAPPHISSHSLTPTSPRFASPRLASPRLASPLFPSLRLALLNCRSFLRRFDFG
jgi:hypothetical protein